MTRMGDDDPLVEVPSRTVGATKRRDRLMIKICTLALTLLTIATLSAVAQQRCRVMDPTGTPLNVREEPAGRVVGQLPNGRLVSLAEHIRDARGRLWVFLHDPRNGDPIGWVFREYVGCF